MLYKESTIAVMIAVMLGAASIFGGFYAVPALALDDPDAVEIANETISQEEDESIIVDTIEMVAEKSTSRASGTLSVELIQDDDVLESATLTTSRISTMAETVELDIANINVTGSFEILVEYLGSGQITIHDIDVTEGTEVAEEDGGDEGNGDEDTGGSGDSGPIGSTDDLENVILTKTITPEDDEELTVDTVEFVAEKSTSRASGTLTVAIVQGDDVLGATEFSSSAISTMMSDMEASFDDIELEGDFDVVFMYYGSGQITITNINVPGTTEPAEDGGSEEDPETDSEIRLTVEAVDQNGNKIEGLWVALLNGGGQLTKKGFTEHNATFILDPTKTYMVEMGDYFNPDTQTSYEFQGWQDSANDNTRRSANPAEFTDNDETFTADYTVIEDAPAPPEEPEDPPGDDPPTTPPPDSPDGTVTAYAYRIPSEHWGPTFTSANAEMYFVVYNSTGWIVYSGFFDEDGHVITGLNEGETYWVSPTDCDECHGDPHDVVFDHWEDGSTERQRPVTTGDSVGAYYKYDPDP